MPASALRLRSYLDRGPQVGWADFFGDTAFLAQTDFAAPQASDPQASGTQASDWTGAELFRLGVMRLGALRQRGEWRGALELLRALERGAEQAKPNDGHLLHIEGLRTALVSGQDHATLRYALKVLEPPPGLDTWTQSYNHLALAHLHFALWNDDEAEQELRAARLKGELPPHPFAFLMSPTDQRLTERWMVALRRGGQLAELLPELAAQEREAAELWPGAPTHELARAVHLSARALCGEVTSEEEWEALTTGLSPHLLGSLASAWHIAQARRLGRSDAAREHARAALQALSRGSEDARSVLYKLDLLLPLLREDRDRAADELVTALDLRMQLMDRARRRASAALLTLAEQTRFLTQVGRERSELLTQLERRQRDSERGSRDLLARLACVAEYRDGHSCDHPARVGRLTTRIARQLGLPEREARALGEAARLHDLGKVSLPDSLLVKPGPLSPAERREMQRHTRAGAEILAGNPALQTAHDIALYHHEHWNGQGYPQGLRGETIPLPARVVAVADAFDSLLSARPFRAPWTREQALAEIRRQSGEQFDPRVVEALEKALAELREAVRW